MLRFFKKDKIVNQLNVLTKDLLRTWEKRNEAVKTLVSKRRNSGFYKMTQGVFDDGYDLVDFETVKEKYIKYFKDKTFLKEDEICVLLKDIYDAGVENKKTNERIDTFAQKLEKNNKNFK